MCPTSEPSKAEREEWITPPPHRLEEAARRLMETVWIHSIDQHQR